MSYIINRDQVLEMCCIGERTLRRLVREGRFPQPFKHVNRRLVWNRNEVVDWCGEVLAAEELLASIH